MLAGLALGLGGCATIVRGTTENITINSEPPAALARISTGITCEATPCTFEMKRETPFSVNYSMPGYQDQQIWVGTKFGLGGGTAMAGNILLGGVIGAGVDSYNGAALEHTPNPVFVTLEPLRPAAVPQEAAPAKKSQSRRSRRRAPVS